MSEVEKMWDWSPRHIRLRYEIFLSAFTVFVIGFFDICKFKLSPFVFENISSRELESYVFIAAVCAFVFLSMTFFSRTNYEITRKDKVLDDLARQTSKISHAIENVDDSKLQKILETVESFQAFYDVENRDNVELKNKMQKLADETSKFQSMFGQLPVDNRKAFFKLHDDEMPSDIFPDSEDRSSLNHVLMIATTMLTQYEDREQRLSNHGLSISNLSKLLSRIDEAVLSQFNRNLEENAKLVKHLRRDIRLKLTFPLKFQKYGVSVLIPYVISLGIFFSGLLKQFSFI